MLYWIFHHFSADMHTFRVFQYLSFRSIVSALTALTLVLFISPYFIRKLNQWQVGQAVRDDGPQTHLKKSGTPTMGGVLLALAIVVSTLLWCDLSNRYVWLLLFVLISFSAIGFVDDFRKVVQKSSRGLPGRWKYCWQSLLAVIVALVLYFSINTPAETQLVIPFFKNVTLNLSWGFIILSYFVIVGSSNAVNLTDGLDGLALMPIVLVGGALGVFAYLSGNYLSANYLAIPYLPGIGELVVFCGGLVGAGLGFLWFNAYPAQVFMGDVGSLGLGAVLGALAVMVRQELVFFLMGGIFVVETLSVILQVGYFKLSHGKRLFLMAPLHHHFELKGWSEPKVIVRFWIITFVLVLLGLATLKLR